MKTETGTTLAPHDKPLLRAKSICQAAVDCWGMDWKVIAGKSRTQSVSTSRRVCGYLLRQRTSMSLEEIGVLCGGRDHSTVIYWVDKTKREYSENPAIAAMIKSIETQAEEIDRLEDSETRALLKGSRRTYNPSEEVEK